MDPVLIRNQRLPVSQVRGILDDVLGIGRVAEEETKSLLSYATIELRVRGKVLLRHQWPEPPQAPFC